MTISIAACPSCGAGLDTSRLTANPACPYCNTSLHVDRSGEELTVTAQAMQNTAADLARIAQETATQNARIAQETATQNARIAQQTATQNAHLQAVWRLERIHDQLADLNGTKQHAEIKRLKQKEHALIKKWPSLKPMPVTVLTPGRSVAFGLLIVVAGLIIDQVIAPVPVALAMLLALVVMILTKRRTIT